jgi:hypothetical protein
VEASILAVGVCAPESVEVIKGIRPLYRSLNSQHTCSTPSTESFPFPPHWHFVLAIATGGGEKLQSTRTMSLQQLQAFNTFLSTTIQTYQGRSPHVVGNKKKNQNQNQWTVSPVHVFYVIWTTRANSQVGPFGVQLAWARSLRIISCNHSYRPLLTRYNRHLLCLSGCVPAEQSRHFALAWVINATSHESTPVESHTKMRSPYIPCRLSTSRYRRSGKIDIWSHHHHAVSWAHSTLLSRNYAHCYWGFDCCCAPFREFVCGGGVQTFSFGALSIFLSCFFVDTTQRNTTQHKGLLTAANMCLLIYSVVKVVALWIKTPQVFRRRIEIVIASWWALSSQQNFDVCAPWLQQDPLLSEDVKDLIDAVASVNGFLQPFRGRILPTLFSIIEGVGMRIIVGKKKRKGCHVLIIFCHSFLPSFHEGRWKGYLALWRVPLTCCKHSWNVRSK